MKNVAIDAVKAKYDQRRLCIVLFVAVEVESFMYVLDIVRSRIVFLCWSQSLRPNQSIQGIVLELVMDLTPPNAFFLENEDAGEYDKRKSFLVYSKL
jgi:hypothetical protein